MQLRASELRSKDVINIADGRKLGNLYDLDVDVETGRIRSLILPAGGRGGWFRARERDVEIPWQDIVRIGVDVILVDLPSSITPHAGASGSS
ncbi:MAG: YlmC/YmxH family sporulation protein [Limnochordaceae bacterium]|nr:YlmC/YmxH family sporulation protein [Limnochordaceae bacterium]